jgi:hypothetical protein
MADVHIGRLALRLTGFDEFQARRLAEKIAGRFQHLVLDDSLPERAEVLCVTLHAAAGATTDWLAAEAVSEVIRELRKS